MPSNKGLVHLFGSNVAALVFAEVVSRKRKVLWHLDGPAKLSGHFAGIKGESGLIYDVGMNAFETSDTSHLINEALSKGSALGRYEAQASINHVKNWIEKFCTLEPFILGTRDTSDSPVYPDFLLSDDFSKGMLHPHLSAIPDVENDLPHPALKYTEPQLFRNWKIRDYYRKIYGKQAGDSILRFSSRYFGRALDDLPVPLHRFVWAPLPWPEYLRSVHDADANGLEHKKQFFSTTNRPISEFLEGLLEKLIFERKNLSITSDGNIHEPSNEELEIHFVDKKQSATSFGLSSNPVQLQCWLTDKPMKSSITSFLNLSNIEAESILRLTSWGDPKKVNGQILWQIVTESTSPLSTLEIEQIQGENAKVILDKSVAFTPKAPESSWFETLTGQSETNLENGTNSVVFEPLSSSLNEQVFRGLEEARKF